MLLIVTKFLTKHKVMSYLDAQCCEVELVICCFISALTSKELAARAWQERRESREEATGSTWQQSQLCPPLSF